MDGDDMSKSKIFIGLVLLVVIALATVMFTQVTLAKRAVEDDSDKIAEGDRLAIQTLAFDFVRKVFSQEAGEADPSPYLAKDAEGLRKLLDIRRTLKAHDPYRSDQAAQFTLENSRYRIQGDSIEVELETLEKTESGEGVTTYRLLVVKEAGHWKILKALSDDGVTHEEFFDAPDVFKAYDMANYDKDIDRINIDKRIAKLDALAEQVNKSG